LLFSSFGSVSYFTGIHTYLLYIFAPPAFLAVVASSGLKRAFYYTPSRFWLGYVVWMILAIPFSSWRGDSLAVVLSYLRTDFIMLLVTAGLAVNWADCRLMIYVIASSAVVNMVTARLLMARAAEGDRISLQSNGMISDPNDLSAHLLLVLPCLVFVMLRPRSPMVVRLLSGSGILYGIFLLLRSGSRGGFLALSFTLLLAIIIATPRQRLIAALAVPAMLVALIAALPEPTWNRLKSISDNSDTTEAAASSREARIYLLKKSIEFTVQHPIFGVGPGQFQNFEGIQAIAEGRAGNWHATHNTFTQVSSECGIPALVFFLGAMISSFRALWRAQRKAAAIKKKEIAVAVSCVTLSLAGYTAASLFLANGYRFQFLAISGLVVSMYRILRKYPVAQPLREQLSEEIRPIDDTEPHALNV